MSIQNMLEKAVETYGVSDILTIMLSQKRDKEIVEEQKRRFKEWEKK